MTKVRERLAKKSQIKQIYMNCGRLSIDSSDHEWINPRTRRKIKGCVLEVGPLGFVELDLRKQDHQDIYDRFLEWVAEDTDSRIVSQHVHEIKEGEVKPPFTWWETTKESQLIKDVIRGAEPMETPGQRDQFIEQCVLYEQQLDNPRKGLIEALLDLDLDIPTNDPMTPKIEEVVKV